MIIKRQSESFTGIIRKLLLIFLIFTFLVTAGSFFLRYTINSKLEKLSTQLNQPWQQPAISRLLIDLNFTENSFQEPSAGGKDSVLHEYKQHLKSIFAKMDLIIKDYEADGKNTLPKSKQQIGLALKQKLAVSQHLFDLQKRFTQLLEKTTSTSIRDYSAEKDFRGINSQADTSVSTYKESTKRSLIKRLRDAVYNTSKVKVLTIRTQEELAKANNERNQVNAMKELGQRYEMLSQSNQELILANLNLLTELRQVLLQLQTIEQVSYQKSREEILNEYKSTSNVLNTYTGVASVFILLFIILLILYMRRASVAERRYMRENLRAVRLAGQKSEILAIMSHEIRNKLMAINGAVFMLKRTALLPEQEKSIASINLSSFLLLETVNNVLDVSKLEHSATGLQISSFAPFEAIRDSVEAMRFMAERKGIELNLQFDGAIDDKVSGDSLRLKQILINLLSNAIKYTDKGEVNLSAELSSAGNNSVLAVSVKDTGSGIPKSQQSKLFSPYYQAGGSKPGTGLGLYLCRQLIKMQGGNIELQSDVGEGCTVRFSIPYSL